VLGGLLLLMSRNRAAAMLGGWLGVIAGAWFVVGRLFSVPWGLGDFGGPVAGTTAGQIASELAFFTGLGTLIVFFGATALGRLSVRSLRDIRYAQRDVTTTAYPVAEPAVRREPVAATTTVPTDGRADDHIADADGSDRRRGWRNMFGRLRRNRTSISN